METAKCATSIAFTELESVNLEACAKGHQTAQ